VHGFGSLRRGSADIAAIGLTVQRETCLLWDSATGRPLGKAIVWQDRRTAPLCNQLRQAGKADDIYQRTGLVLDAYFSATKLAWLLDNAKKETDPPIDFDQVLAGTVDSWVLWNLTGRQVHATDHSNASRTMLLNIESGGWDETLLSLFNIAPQMMPMIRPSVGLFGHTDAAVIGAEIPITAIFGDQQAALYGHGCDRPGLLKCTYGTGAFLVSHTGTRWCDRTISSCLPLPGPRLTVTPSTLTLAMPLRAACLPPEPAFNGCGMVCRPLPMPPKPNPWPKPSATTAAFTLSRPSAASEPPLGHDRPRRVSGYYRWHQP
jgi:glycerol kinase